MWQTFSRVSSRETFGTENPRKERRTRNAKQNDLPVRLSSESRRISASNFATAASLKLCRGSPEKALCHIKHIYTRRARIYTTTRTRSDSTYPPYLFVSVVLVTFLVLYLTRGLILRLRKLPRFLVLRKRSLRSCSNRLGKFSRVASIRTFYLHSCETLSKRRSSGYLYFVSVKIETCVVVTTNCVSVGSIG